MGLYRRVFGSLMRPCSFVNSPFLSKLYHRIPFFDLYHRTTGKTISESFLPDLKKKHPHIVDLSHERLEYTLQILNKFGITALEACNNPHVFSMNPITVDNYGEILKECGFIKIIPKYIMRYLTLVKSRNIADLKKDGLIRSDILLEESLQNCIKEWPSECRVLQNFKESETNILTVRLSVLEKYLAWRLSVTSEDFLKYCKLYLPMKHKPMVDIIEALNLAQNVFEFDKDTIRRNGFLISTDPIKTRLIYENVKTIAGLNLKDAVKIEPGLLKNNHNYLLEIGNILKEYQIPLDAQRRCLRVFCMRPQNVKERLDELKEMKEFQVLQTNPRVLWMVVHKRKMVKRLEQIQSAKKQCYSLNHLVASKAVFNNYLLGFGSKVCGRDIAILISSAVHESGRPMPKRGNSEPVKAVIKQLRRHKYWLHAALSVIDENIKYLKSKFSNEIVFHNCQLLLYPVSEIKYYLEHMLKLRNGEIDLSDRSGIQLDSTYNNVSCRQLTDNQIVSLVLYEIEKKYHFSGDGIWSTQEGLKAEAQKS